MSNSKFLTLSDFSFIYVSFVEIEQVCTASHGSGSRFKRGFDSVQSIAGYNKQIPTERARERDLEFHLAELTKI